jgi:YHS domain-containing protein
MKINSIYRTILPLTILVLGINHAQAASAIYKTFFGSKAIGGYDAVAYHSSQQAVKGSKHHILRWKGANWFFSSAKNLAAFKAEPEKFAPQFGGYCAWAVAEKNQLVKIDPTVFDLVDGKLYLNYNQDTQRKWRADRSGMIHRGNVHYGKLITE